MSKFENSIFFIIVTSKSIVLAPKPTAKFLTVKIEVLQKFLYLLSLRYPKKGNFRNFKD